MRLQIQRARECEYTTGPAKKPPEASQVRQQSFACLHHSCFNMVCETVSVPHRRQKQRMPWMPSWQKCSSLRRSSSSSSSPSGPAKQTWMKKRTMLPTSWRSITPSPIELHRPLMTNLQDWQDLMQSSMAHPIPDRRLKSSLVSKMALDVCCSPSTTSSPLA